MRIAAGGDGPIHRVPLALAIEAEFCTPAQAHEKGGVEGEAGYFRRNHWVPVPEAEDLAALNRHLLNACQQDEHRMIAGREQTVGASLLIERDHLLPLVEGFDLAQISYPAVNGFGCVKVLMNAYSVPVLAGVQVQAKAYAARLELWHEGGCVARHERCYGRQQQILELKSISTCCIASRERWPDRKLWSRGARPDCGQQASSGSGR